jgi:hypothetical protein
MQLAMQRDPSRMPAAYPVPSSASIGPVKKQAETKPMPPQPVKAGG